MLGTIAAVAAANHGVFTDEDLRRVGATDRQRRALLRAGWCESMARGTYRVAGAPASPQQRLAIALAHHGSDGLASARTAACIWGVPGYAIGLKPELLVDERTHRRSSVAVLHASALILPAHRSRYEGFAVTSPARTAFDLAAREPLARVERVVDHFLARRLATLEELHAVVFALARRGRAGTTTMRSVMEDRGAGYVAPASELERVARILFREAGLPQPAFEVDLGDGSWIGRVDCLWRDARLVVELDGRRYHDGRTQLDADRRRDNRLMAEGWRVLRFTWEDLIQRPAEVVATIRAALAT